MSCGPGVAGTSGLFVNSSEMSTCYQAKARPKSGSEIDLKLFFLCTMHHGIYELFFDQKEPHV